MDFNDSVSINDLLSEILVLAGDEELRTGITKGWYTLMIQRALEDVAFETFFDKRTEDFRLNKTNLALEIPPNAFNIKEIYLFNGECGVDTTVPVHWKRGFNNKPRGNGSTSRRRDDQAGSSNDVFFGRRNLFKARRFGFGKFEQLYYGNIQNGLIMFSDNAGDFENVRLIFNGMGVPIGDKPIVPRIFRDYVVDFVLMKYFAARMSRDVRQFRPLYIEYKTNLMDLRNGSRRRAKMLVKSMNGFQKDTMKQFIGRFDT